MLGCSQEDAVNIMSCLNYVNFTIWYCIAKITAQYFGIDSYVITIDTVKIYTYLTESVSLVKGKGRGEFEGGVKNTPSSTWR